MRLHQQPGHVRADLDAPQAGNSLNTRTLTALMTALDEAETTPDCRAFVIGGEGKVFCSGLDLTDLSTRWLVDDFPLPWRLLERLVASPLVTIAVVDGPALGGGVGLAAACDLVIAGSSASFRFTETLLGLVPAIILPFVVRRVGAHPALRMMLTSERLDAAGAVQTGLADEEAVDTQQALRACLQRLRRADPDAIRALKAYHYTLHPVAVDPAGVALLRDRLGDPAVRARIGRLRHQGYPTWT
ncbi:enoyl-CoA hydratase/isomerase family protein [Streptomyces formicae]|uniref:Enoyl-CoA hydratase/isomerase family protein n=1 Tax=Streptomyces formicae TaxID=1616117 RepID=A0ABY3WRQ3_9ACTN|nr:enoyl-CoA hydratase/isomerase family protein [Streptomyces formicae]UNM14785.1 enoyl-CoA hydratase/isomerase family protein [Streptomyces formicae]